ncbi:MAG: radical SAM family heme chaperone HemW [Ottowia sp.]
MPAPLPSLVSATPASRPVGDVRHYMRPGLLQLSALPPLSLYIHIPWCLRKCPYCDFNSHESSRGEPLPENEYVDALLADLQVCLPMVWGRSVISVFLGGGTPSLFSPEAIERLLSGVRALLPLLPGAEITLEANPGTFERERFAAFRAAGITRLSVGVQSFNDRHLQAIGRVHSAEQARAALQEAARAFETFNLDLMYALPGQSLDELAQDVQTALSFAPPHLSIYHLTVEEGTAFAKRPPRLPDEDAAFDMLDALTAATAQAGLARYEVSAYARGPMHQCVHNTNYWQFGDYLGLGAGAHAKISFAHRIVRQTRHKNPRHYMQQALAGCPVHEERDIARAELPFEYMLGALRLRDGFSLGDYCARTGLPPGTVTPALEQAEEKGWVQRQGNHIRPTERGFDFLSDLQQLFLE